MLLNVATNTICYIYLNKKKLQENFEKVLREKYVYSIKII